MKTAPSQSHSLLKKGKKLSHYDGFANAFLRGIAILAVLILHILSSVHLGFVTTNSFWRSFVATDQACRFAVPLFVALSGYGFWQKYQQTSFHWASFLWRQGLKLLPLYILASAIFYADSLYYAGWQFFNLKSFFLQLIWGSADYHLYFVPMIFQLYLLFPVCRKLVQKFPWLSLLAAAIFQVWLYLLFSSLTPSPFIVKYLLTDQQQYFWFFTWIFYFILGMHLPLMMKWVKDHGWAFWILVVSVVSAWWWATTQGIIAMLHGIDPIIALRATHVEVLVYASLMVLLLMVVAQLVSPKIKKLASPFVILGNFSYVIYLFHPLVLQVLFSY